MSAPRRRRGAAANGSQRREQLLDAAERVFHRRGYAGATIQEIADEFGILKGSTYHYVRSKEQLLIEVEKRTHRHAYANVATAVESVADPIDRLWVYIHSMILINAQTPTIGSLAKATLELPPGPGRDGIMQERRRFEDLLRRLITEARSAGALGGDLDEKVVAYGIFGLINSIYRWYAPEGGLSPDELARTYADMLLGGLTSTPAVDSAPWQCLTAESTLSAT